MKHALFGLLMVSLGACGGAPAGDRHAAFAAIQVDEARIAHASLALETSGDEIDRETLAGEICEASDHLAGIAAPLDDRDARTRSDRARATCETARARVTTP